MATGSSRMPQEQCSDVLDLVRGHGGQSAEGVRRDARVGSGEEELSERHSAGAGEGGSCENVCAVVIPSEARPGRLGKSNLQIHASLPTSRRATLAVT